MTGGNVRCGFFYLDVGHPMVVEVGRGGESLAADGALVRLLPAVDASVGVERTRRREPFAADVAHVWFLTCSNQNRSIKQLFKKNLETKSGRILWLTYVTKYDAT